jgi:hypothetical protein
MYDIFKLSLDYCMKVLFQGYESILQNICILISKLMLMIEKGYTCLHVFYIFMTFYKLFIENKPIIYNHK